MTVKMIIPTHYEMETGDTPPTEVRKPVTTLRDILTNAMWITYDGGENWIVADKRMRLVEEDGTPIDLVTGLTAMEALKTYEFSINGVNFNGYAGIKTLLLEGIADVSTFRTLHHYDVAGDKVDYVVPALKVFIAYQALVWAASVSTIGRIGESVNADGAGNGDAGIQKDVLFLGNGTTSPFMVACYGVFSAGKYVTASAVDGNDLKQHTTLFGVERDV